MMRTTSLSEHVSNIRQQNTTIPSSEVKAAERLGREELEALVSASLTAIESGGGFGWVNTPHIDNLRAYWQGVLLMPQRRLLLGKLDGIVAGALQLARYPRNNEAQSMLAIMEGAFVAPEARGYGIGRALIQAAESTALVDGVVRIEIQVRATQKEAIRLYTDEGYVKWGENAHYAYINNKWIAGYYMGKDLT